MTGVESRIRTGLALGLLAAACFAVAAASRAENPATQAAAAPTAAAAAATPAGKKPAARLFVTNYRDNTLSVVDPILEKEIKTLPMPESPEGLALRPDPLLVAVANSTADYVTLLDPVSLEVLGTISCGKGPDDLVFSKDGKLLYTTSSVESTVYTLDVAKRSVVSVMPAFKGRPIRLEISPDGKTLYVLAKAEAGEVVAVDIATGKIRARAAAGKYPTDIGISSDGKWVLSASFDNDEVSVIDTATMKVVRVFPAGTGFGLLVHPTKPIAYSMASFDDEVQVLDYMNGKTLAVLELGNYPSFSAISPDGKYLYVVHEESDNVVKVDTDTNESVVRIAVGDEPSEALYVPLP